MQQQVTDNHAADLDRLLAEHRDLDQRLQELEHQLHLTPEEEMEVHRLKKLKLAKKDEIYNLRTRYGG